MKGDFMGLLDDVMGMVGMHRGQSQVEQHQNILSTLSAMLSNPNSGGISGLLQKLQAGGLASAVQSWIGAGKNQAISPDQLHRRWETIASPDRQSSRNVAAGCIERFVRAFAGAGGQAKPGRTTP